VRTKYYVLKAFASTAEVILKLLEDSRNLPQRTSKVSHQSTFSVKRASDRVRSAGSVFSSPRMRRIVSLVSVFGKRADDVPSVSGQRSEVQLDDWEALNALAVEWIEKLEQFGGIYPVAKPRSLLLRGRYLLLTRGNTGEIGGLGRGNSGLSFLRQALASARSLAMPYEEGLAHFELARVATSKVEVNKHLQVAKKIFDEVGAKHDSQRCDDSLSISSSLQVIPAAWSGRSFRYAKKPKSAHSS